MGKTDYLEHELLKWCTGQANALDDGIITPHLGFFTAAPTDVGGGTEVSVTGTGYARQSLAGKFPTPANGQVANSAVINFPVAAADWGALVAYGLFTAATGGQLLRWENLTPARTILKGGTLSIAAGKLILLED